MNDVLTKTVTYSQLDNDIFISLNYSDGGCAGEFSIINTRFGFQLKAYDDSWKIFSNCTDLFELLSKQLTMDMTMKQLAEIISDIGYELIVR